MALVSPGSTKCAICGRVIEDMKDVTGLPHFISDPKDSFYQFTDAAVHMSCYLAWPLKAEWEAKFKKDKADREAALRRWLDTGLST